MTPASNLNKPAVLKRPCNRTWTALLAIACTCWWPKVECEAQEVHKNSSNATSSAYKMVVRVVRPVWSAEALRAFVRPRALPGNLFRFADPDSDTQFLQTLRKENPGFVFDTVHAKRALTLPVDKEWQIPSDLTYQKLNLGVFVKNKDLLLNHLSSSGSLVLANGKISKSSDHPLTYKVDMTDRQLEQVRRSGKIMVCYQIQQYFPDGKNLKQYMQSDMIQFMQLGDTACLGTVLAVTDVPLDAKPLTAGKPNPVKPMLMPTDLIFVTITK